MRYLLISGPVGSSTPDKPFQIFIEDGKDIQPHSLIPEDVESFPERVKFDQIKTLEDIVATGYTYYKIEIGQYEGADKERIDKMIASLEDEQEAE